MNKSIAENLPGFMFPNAFMDSLPKEYDPVDVGTIDDRPFRRAIFEMKGSMRDYVFTAQIERMKRGVLRDVRRFADGTVFVRFDSPFRNRINNPVTPLQFVMHLDSCNHLLHYTNVFPEMKQYNAYSVTQGKKCRIVNSAEDMLCILRNAVAGSEVLICPPGESSRSLRLVTKDKRVWDVRFYFDHPPFTFQITNQDCTSVKRLLCRYFSCGLLGLVDEPNLEYWFCTMDPSWWPCLGVYQRLLFHRFRAEFEGDKNVILLMDRLGIADNPNSPTIWMPRLIAPWEKVVENLYRIARGFPLGRVDYYGRPLSLLDCDRIVAYAALEGCPAAREEVGKKIFQGVMLNWE